MGSREASEAEIQAAEGELVIIPNSFFNVRVLGSSYRELSTKLNEEIQRLVPGEGEVDILKFEIDEYPFAGHRFRGMAKVKLS